MKPPKKFFPAVLAAVLAIGFGSVSAKGEVLSDTEVRIGLVEEPSPAFYADVFGPTINYLREKLPGLRFKTRELSYDGFRKSAEGKELDFFIAPSGIYANAESQYGARHLATESVNQSDDPAHAVAGAVVIRADDQRFRKLGDLKGASVASENEQSFQGWLAVLGEIHRQGFDPEHFWGKEFFTQYQLPNAASLVLAGEAHAAVIEACELEELERSGAVPAGSLRVISPKSDSLSCWHTTATYPGTVFASLPRANPGIVKKVAVALLSMPKLENGSSWGFASDFTSVQKLYSDLKTGPYAYLREWSAAALWAKWQWVLWLVLAVAAFATFHILRANRLVRLRTEELERTVAERDRIENLAQKDRERLVQLERAGVVSQLSGMLAHEIRQPAAALVNYAGGFRLYMKQKGVKDPVAEEATAAIVEGAKRISDIIEHVRRYAKQQQSVQKPERLDEILRHTLQTFSHTTLGKSVPVSCGPLEEAWVNADALEIELVIMNLLRNSASAVKPRKEPKISVDLSRADLAGNRAWRITVTDNGPEITDEAFALLSKPVISKKSDGLGLGLSLSRIIIEKHAGRLSFERARGGGLSASVTLGALEEKELEDGTVRKGETP